MLLRSIHSDATLKIRTRIFLEGNFYVDLSPGSPSAPIVSSGATIPAANTAGPVQLDRVLSSLSSSTRQDLQTLLRGFGGALDGTPTAAEDVTQDPADRGKTAGQALNQSLDNSPEALEASAIVNQALLGTDPNADLQNVVTGNEQTLTALADTRLQLSGLVDGFDRTMAALASRQQQLSQTVSLLPSLLQASNGALTQLDASFKPTAQFARDILPGVKQTGPTIDAALPWIAQTQKLVSKSQLGGLLQDLTPAVQNTAATVGSLKSLLGGLDQFNRCLLRDLIPTGNETILDPPLGTGVPLYYELYQSAVGLAGVAQGFDGNGRFLRAQTGGGSVPITTGPLGGGEGPMRGNALRAPLGTRPAWPGSQPPYNRSVPCYTYAAPDLNSAQTGAGP